MTTGAGQVEVTAPRVADRRPEGERERYASSIRPPYMRTSPRVDGTKELVAVADGYRESTES